MFDYGFKFTQLQQVGTLCTCCIIYYKNIKTDRCSCVALFSAFLRFDSLDMSLPTRYLLIIIYLYYLPAVY